jgi:hypothetical protein
MVADRDWFHAAPDMYFEFYTTPLLKVYMPLDEVKNLTSSVFARVKAVVRRGGFATFDVG